MFLNAFVLALRTIGRNVLRSFLTILGIVIGVASVIAMVILGDGTTAYVTNSISKLGSNMLIIHPGKEVHGPPSLGAGQIPFEMADVTAIKREIAGIKAVAPVTSGMINTVYGNKNHSTNIYGSDNDYFIARDWELELGRVFSASEQKSGKAVCVIGKTVQKELFEEQNPIGANIRLEKFSCLVIGLFKSKGASSFGMDQDDLIVSPISMVHRRISGNQSVPTILVSAMDGISTKMVKEGVTVLLRERRHIREDANDDFYVRDMKDIINTLSSTTKMLTLLLGAVAAISLLVGGIGIMNIMLVSVTERTREIGIRLAIGAMEREVLMQFLVESVVLSSIGGVIGIILGLGIAAGVTTWFEIPLILNKFIIVIAFLFSSAVGIIFGFFPARKAARLDPIEALRHE